MNSFSNVNMSGQTTRGYHKLMKLIHWVTAFLVLAMVPFGFFMAYLDPAPFKFALYQWHKSIGMIVLSLFLLRVLVKLLVPSPAHLPSHKPWEVALARIIHIALYGMILGIPLSGWIMTSASGYPLQFFGLFQVPDLVGKNAALAGMAKQAHETMVFLIIGALALHIAGAVKHSLIDEDMTMARMVPGKDEKFHDISPSKKLFGGVAVLYAFIAFAITAFLLLQGTLFGAENHHDHDDKKATVSQGAEQDVNANSGQASAHSHIHAHTNAAQSWQVNMDQSQIGFSVDISGKLTKGVFENFESEIAFSPEYLDQSSIEFKVFINSVQSQDDNRDTTMQEEDWLGQTKFPFAQFVSHSITLANPNIAAITDLDDGNEGDQKVAATKSQLSIENDDGEAGAIYNISGDFTLKGVTKNITLPVRIAIIDGGDEGGGKSAHANGLFIIKRADYNIGTTGQWAETDMVGGDVAIHFDVVAQMPDPS